MAISVKDQALLAQEQKNETTQLAVLDQLKALNAVAAEIKDLLAQIHECLCNEVTGIGVDIQPPTPH